jgi:hypothetical protein
LSPRAVIVAITLTLVGAGGDDSPVADPKLAELPARVAERIQQAKPAAPMAWTRIPWVESLAQARDLGKQESRPVFLLSLEGNLALGRC